MSPRLQGALLVALPILAANAPSSDTRPEREDNCIQKELAATPMLHAGDPLQMRARSLELTVCAVAPKLGGEDYSLVATQMRRLSVLLVKRSDLDATLEQTVAAEFAIDSEPRQPDLRPPTQWQTSAERTYRHRARSFGSDSSRIAINVAHGPGTPPSPRPLDAVHSGP